MTAILSHLDTQTTFEPEALRVMSEAFDDACNALRYSPETSTDGRSSRRASSIWRVQV